jgi:hypothetical protein
VSSLSCDEVSSDIGSKVDDEYAGPDAVDPEQEELAEVLKMEEPLPIRMGGFAEQALVEWGDEESNNQDEEVTFSLIKLFRSHMLYSFVYLFCRYCPRFSNSPLRRGFVLSIAVMMFFH